MPRDGAITLGQKQPTDFGWLSEPSSTLVCALSRSIATAPAKVSTTTSVLAALRLTVEVLSYAYVIKT